MSGSSSSNPDGRAAPADEPLALTVHSLPSSADPGAVDPARTKSGRWTMVFVLLVCMAPVVASYFTYHVIRPSGHARYGELIDPQRPLPDVPTTGLDGAAGNLRALKGQWLLVSVAPASCDKACQSNLYWQRQLRETLGREKDRVDRVWLVTDEATPAAAMQPALSEFTVLRVPAATVSGWLQPEAGHQIGEHIYVVDPMGNWMMRFPAAMDLAGAGKAKRDLDRLLRASNSWDLPGR